MFLSRFFHVFGLSSTRNSVSSDWKLSFWKNPARVKILRNTVCCVDRDRVFGLQRQECAPLSPLGGVTNEATFLAMVDAVEIVLVTGLPAGLFTCLHIHVQLLFHYIEEQRCQTALRRSLLQNLTLPRHRPRRRCCRFWTRRSDF